MTCQPSKEPARRSQRILARQLRDAGHTQRILARQEAQDAVHTQRQLARQEEQIAIHTQRILARQAQDALHSQAVHNAQSSALKQLEQRVQDAYLTQIAHQSQEPVPHKVIRSVQKPVRSQFTHQMQDPSHVLAVDKEDLRRQSLRRAQTFHCQTLNNVQNPIRSRPTQKVRDPEINAFLQRYGQTPREPPRRRRKIILRQGGIPWPKGPILSEQHSLGVRKAVEAMFTSLHEAARLSRSMDDVTRKEKVRPKELPRRDALLKMLPKLYTTF